MTNEQIAFRVGYAIGMYGPVILGGIVIAAVIIGAILWSNRCGRDD